MSRSRRLAIVLAIVAFPSIFWLLLESSSIHARRMPVYGPKHAVGKDTVFYSVPPVTGNGGLEAVVFACRHSRPEGYRIAGIWEYLRFKRSKIREVPLLFVTQGSTVEEDLIKVKAYGNIRLVNASDSAFARLRKAYFKEKPYYIDSTFVVLVDDAHRIRGYYDARYVSEVKRLIEEYQHLRLKEEKIKIIRDNEIGNH